MPLEISTFNTSYLSQLENLPPEEWQTNAYDLFLYNEWQPWFFPFQAIIKNQLVGFGMFFLFEEFAWLGWILVHPDFRKKGIGTTITHHLIDSASEKGAKGFVLTATDMGKPIYEKIGFKTTSSYRFFKLPDDFYPKYNKKNIRLAQQKDLQAIINLDYLATGEKRNCFIENRLDDCIVYDDGAVTGFYIPNLGNGLVIALNENVGIELLNLRCNNDKKIVVVPEQNITTTEYLLQNHFLEGYSIPRMTLGKEPPWQQKMIFNRASGYSG